MLKLDRRYASKLPDASRETLQKTASFNIAPEVLDDQFSKAG